MNPREFSTSRMPVMRMTAAFLLALALPMLLSASTGLDGWT
jgi:hypothetical protein